MLEFYQHVLQESLGTNAVLGFAVQSFDKFAHPHRGMYIR